MKRIQINTLSTVTTLASSEMQSTAGGLKIQKCFRIPFTKRRICFSVEIGLGLRRR